MLEVLRELSRRCRAGETLALATVIDAQGSSPQPPGACLMVTSSGKFVGSVSGGCVEGAVVESAQQVLATGAHVLERFGYSSESAFAAGLTCGGSLEVFIERFDGSQAEILDSLCSDIENGRPVALVTVVEHPNPEIVGTHLAVHPDAGDEFDLPRFGGFGITDALLDTVRALARRDESGTVWLSRSEVDTSSGTRIFIRTFSVRPRMLVLGAIDFAASMAEVGQFLGYQVTVCDARASFATRARFPHADEVVVDWPHRYLDVEIREGRIDDRTAICVLTHDAKFDIPLLERALRLPEVAYVGAMGSRRTHDERLTRLREAGLTEEQLGRLSSPVGLDIGARSPAETAISIAAELIALTHGGSGRRLRNTTGPIHQRSRTVDNAVARGARRERQDA